MQNLAVLAALGFASARATQLVVHDSIADPVRNKIELWEAHNFGTRKGSAIKFLKDLISCTYCAGWHLSWITLVAYLTATGQWGSAPLLVHGIEAWAVAGVQALLNRFDDTLGTGGR